MHSLRSSSVRLICESFPAASPSQSRTGFESADPPFVTPPRGLLRSGRANENEGTRDTWPTPALGLPVTTEQTGPASHLQAGCSGFDSQPGHHIISRLAGRSPSAASFHRLPRRTRSQSHRRTQLTFSTLPSDGPS